MDYQKSEDEYSIIKVYLTILVVIGHSIVFFSDYGGVVEVPFHAVLNYCYHYIHTFFMPMFIFISGAVYQQGISKGKYQDNYIFIKKKVLRLIVPYFLWGIFYVAPILKILGFIKESYFHYIFHGLILGKDSRHLWFLWTLFFIFIIMRLLKPILEKGMISEIIIFEISIVICYYSWDLPSIFGINSIAHYFAYFMFGYLFERKREFLFLFLKKNFMISFVLLLITAILVGISDNFNIHFVLPWVCIIMICGLVSIFSNYLCKGKWYCKVKENSFGIYLAHPMIIYVLVYFFQNTIVHPILFCSIIFFIALWVSCFISKVIRKMGLKVLLGEI